jgi:hypothetical protein
LGNRLADPPQENSGHAPAARNGETSGPGAAIPMFALPPNADSLLTFASPGISPGTGKASTSDRDPSRPNQAEFPRNLEQAALAENARPGALGESQTVPGATPAPLGINQLARALGIPVASVDQAIQEYIHEIDDWGGTLSGLLAVDGPEVLIVGAIAAAATAAAAYHFARRSRPREGGADRAEKALILEPLSIED